MGEVHPRKQEQEDVDGGKDARDHGQRYSERVGERHCLQRIRRHEIPGNDATPRVHADEHQAVISQHRGYKKRRDQRLRRPHGGFVADAPCQSQAEHRHRAEHAKHQPKVRKDCAGGDAETADVDEKENGRRQEPQRQLETQTREPGIPV
jgi:hypothetical protein